MATLILKGTSHSYIFDPFEKLCQIQKGGKFGDIYRGNRLSDNLSVIIKHFNPLIKDKYFAFSKFQKEGMLCFNHNNIAKTYDFIKHNEDYYIVIEHITGFDLKTILKTNSIKKQLSYQSKIKIIIDVLSALEIVHQAKYSHCDIKPSNIFLECNVEGRKIDLLQFTVKLIDFGQAKKIDEPFIKSPPLFSLLYSPPEQVLNLHTLCNLTVDIYSTGITLYELISGEAPFKDSNPLKLMALQINYEIKSHKNIPEDLFAILCKATAKYKLPKPPHQYQLAQLKEMLIAGQQMRYQSTTEFITDLKKLL